MILIVVAALEWSLLSYYAYNCIDERHAESVTAPGSIITIFQFQAWEVAEGRGGGGLEGGTKEMFR